MPNAEMKSESQKRREAGFRRRDERSVETQETVGETGKHGKYSFKLSSVSVSLVS